MEIINPLQKCVFSYLIPVDIMLFGVISGHGELRKCCPEGLWSPCACRFSKALSGHGPRQPALGRCPCMSRRVGQDDLQRTFATSTMLQFCKGVFCLVSFFKKEYRKSPVKRGTEFCLPAYTIAIVIISLLEVSMMA